MNNIGKRIEMVRNFLGLNKAEFGVKLDWDIEQVSDVEKGRKKVETSQIPFICQRYGIRLEWLQMGTGKMMLSSEEIAENCFKLYMQPFFAECSDEAAEILKNDKEYQDEKMELENLIKKVEKLTTFSIADELLSQSQAVCNVENHMMFTLGLRYGVKFAKMLGILECKGNDPKDRIMNMRKFIL